MVRDKDLISVIVPVYNVESYIDKCIIGSAKKQCELRTMTYICECMP